jgi:hypothetical protein
MDKAESGGTNAADPVDPPSQSGRGPARDHGRRFPDPPPWGGPKKKQAHVGQGPEVNRDGPTRIPVHRDPAVQRLF